METANLTLTQNTRIFLALAMVVGISVLVVAALLILLSLLWVVVSGVSLILAHTTSVNLFMMVIVGYEIYKGGKTYIRKSGVLCVR